jgi:hypothetical protein
LKLKTWHLESALVAIILIVVNLFLANHWYEWIGALAVWLSFGHASISFRMEEAEAIREVENGKPNVECYKWLGRYYLAKEASWFLYFSILSAYSALVGVFVFLLYPYWRKFWTKRKMALVRIANGSKS